MSGGVISILGPSRQYDRLHVESGVATASENRLVGVPFPLSGKLAPSFLRFGLDKQ